MSRTKEPRLPTAASSSRMSGMPMIPASSSHSSTRSSWTAANRSGRLTAAGRRHPQPPDQIDQYQLASFSSYDLKLSLNQSGYAATEERPVVRPAHCPTQTIPMARPVGATTIDGILQRSGLSNRLARLLPSRRPGRHRLETIRTNRRICRRRAGHHRLLHAECRLRISGDDDQDSALRRSLVTEWHLSCQSHCCGFTT